MRDSRHRLTSTQDTHQGQDVPYRLLRGAGQSALTPSHSLSSWQLPGGADLKQQGAACIDMYMCRPTRGRHCKKTGCDSWKFCCLMPSANSVSSQRKTGVPARCTVCRLPAGLASHKGVAPLFPFAPAYAAFLRCPTCTAQASGADTGSKGLRASTYANRHQASDAGSHWH